MTTFRTEVVTVTPALAKEWLDRNTENRKLSKHIVEKYAATMRAGRWLLTHQGIAFDEYDNLHDGQHRLAAVVAANVALPMTITWGVPKDTFASVDNTYRRSIAQLLPTQHRSAVAASLRFLVVADPGFEMSNHVTAGIYDSGASTDLLWEVFDSWKDVVEVAAGLAGTVYHSTRINIAAHTAVLSQALRSPFADRVTAWCEGLQNGVGLDANDARLLLRNRFIREARVLNSTAGRHLAYPLIVKGWNAHATGASLGVLKMVTGENAPQVVGRS